MNQIINKFIVSVVSRRADNRPVRWIMNAGDYDGHERTIEIFCVDFKEQRPLLHELSLFQPILQFIIGGPPVFIFHTNAESQRLYKDFIDNWYQNAEVN